MITRLALIVFFAIPVTAGVWTFVWQPRQQAARRQALLAQLPRLPDFAHQNQISVEKFQVADRLVRQDPFSPEGVGRLGMLYHAYQFNREALSAYRLVRELAPDEFVWIYYLAVLRKAVFDFEESERLFRRAIELRPGSAELWAELGDLYLKWSRRSEASASLNAAIELDPIQPVAALGRARLAILDQDWDGAVRLLTPLLEQYPRLSLCHKYLATAYERLGLTDEQARHQEMSEYGSAIESPLMRELHDLSVDAILDSGDPSAGPALLDDKCARCHTHGRIYDTDQDRRWWARTVRRMQREAGWAWLTDAQAASVVAYLADQYVSGDGSR